MEQVFASQNEIEHLRSSHKGHIFRETRFSDNFATIESGYLQSQVAIPSFDEKEYELWIASGKVFYQNGEVELSALNDYRLMRIIAQEKGLGLELSTYEIYKKLFQYIKENNVGSLVRVWNYVPKILGETQGLERYRQFNIGRHRAWQDYGLKSDDGQPISPAATGISSHGGPIVIEALLTNHPVTYLQNPRQKPAHLYSSKYGPKAPVFSRATLCQGPNPEIYISGTASLSGEDVVWIGEPQKQVQEIFKIISALIAKDNVSAYGKALDFSLKNLIDVRVYIKNKTDYRIIREEVEKILGDKEVMYLHDDICRQDFLVEIEGIARK